MAKFVDAAGEKTFAEAYDGKLGVSDDTPEWIKLGCGGDEYICAEKNISFSYDATELPDLAEHNNFVCDELKGNPKLWEELKDKKTSFGTKLTHCIKTGIDNKGHPMIKTVGMVACDEECYTVFGALFDPVISARHNGYAADAKHPTCMDPSQLLDTKIDPDNNYVLTTRCRTGRSIKGFRLPPTIEFGERRKLEATIVEGLRKMEGELAGEYYPLVGSKSVDNTMTEEQETALRSAGNLFQEPDSTLLLSSGCGRHWPDARGIFHNEAKNFFVWVSEEDQMRIVSMEKGDNVNAIFTRFANATKAVESVAEFMQNDHLGYILTCPSNLGTGLRAGAMVKVPKVSGCENFKKLVAQMGLQVRGTAGVDSASTGGTWDISNADRLGKSETHLVNTFIKGVSTIIAWEKKMEAGEDVQAEMDAYTQPTC